MIEEDILKVHFKYFQFFYSYMFMKLLEVYDVGNWVKSTGHNTIKMKKVQSKENLSVEIKVEN